ncbi:DEAD/DEAH box helicase [Akkermansiaceae bacterium]|nr:DEAD/DEAH box helicase [Akkermansiaceae bacterium]
MTFSDLGLSKPLLDAIEELGYTTPSLIQEKAIPVIFQGQDIIGLSATGSGKTAAFALPALDKIDPEIRKPQILILSPTRELCSQVCADVEKLGKNFPNVRPLALYGGSPMDKQLQSLRRGAQVVVGTPGRLFDHLRRGTLDTKNIKMCILDEADRMLDMGFRDEMEELLSKLPNDLQTLFFSATMNKQVEKLINRFGNSPQEITVTSKNKTVSSIVQSAYQVKVSSKVEVISRIVDISKPKLAVVFCNTKKSVDECTESLLARGYSADRLHGDITQALRERVIARFKVGKIKLLIATDVAGRGLDIEDVEMVINYDLPQDPEDYVHRIGRTGRAGRTGTAISFSSGRDGYRLKAIERYTSQKIERSKIPTFDEAEANKSASLIETIEAKNATAANEANVAHIASLIEKGVDITALAASMFELLLEKSGNTREKIPEDYGKDSPFANERDGRGGRDRDRGRGRDRDRGDRPDRGERGDRSPRSRNKDGEAPRLEKGMTQIFIGIGTKLGCQAKDIVGMLYSETSVGNGNVGRIRLFPKHSLVQVPDNVAPSVIKELGNSKLKGKPFSVHLDRDID